MSQPNTINPYPLIGTQVADGLNAIILAVPSTVDELVNVVYNFIQPLYYPGATTKTAIEVKSIAYNAVNSYRSNLVLSGNSYYDSSQVGFIQMMIGAGMTANTAPDSFADRIANVEENVGISNLTVDEQTPLFLATTIGSHANSYWLNQVALGGSSPWLNYFSTNSGQNYLNVLLWAVASMNGALAGYGATPKGLVSPSTDSLSTNMISSLIGGLTVSAGKVMFKWTPRIAQTLSNASSLSRFQSDYLEIVGDGSNPYSTGSYLFKRKTKDEIGTIQRSTGRFDKRIDGEISYPAVLDDLDS